MEPLETVTLASFEFDQTTQLWGLPFCFTGKQPKFKDVTYFPNHLSSLNIEFGLRELMKNIDQVYKKYGAPACPFTLVPFILLGFGLYSTFDYGHDITHEVNVLKYVGTFGGSFGMFTIWFLIGCFLNSKKEKKVRELMYHYNQIIHPMGLKVEWNYAQISRRNSNDPVINLALQVNMLITLRQVYCMQRNIPFESPLISLPPLPTETAVVQIQPQINDAPPSYSALFNPSNPNPVTLNLDPPKYDFPLSALPYK